MYKQVIPTFRPLSAYDEQCERVLLKIFKQSAEARAYREQLSFSNNKKWRMNHRELEKLYLHDKHFVDMIALQHLGCDSDTYVKFNNDYQNALMVYNTL